MQYVSEVCTLDGTSFVPDILEGNDCQTQLPNNTHETTLRKTGEHSWML